MKLLPIALDVRGKKCLVVGGGSIAWFKASKLHDCGARVLIVAPELCDELEAQSATYSIFKRTFQPEDCADCTLVFACTDVREVNADVAKTAHEVGALCNIADNDDGDFAMMATLRRGAISIGVSTQGGSPALARYLKEKIADTIGNEYAELLELLSARRAEMKNQIGAQSERADIWRRVLESEALSLLREGKRAEAEKLVDEIIKSTPE